MKILEHFPLDKHKTILVFIASLIIRQHHHLQTVQVELKKKQQNSYRNIAPLLRRTSITNFKTKFLVKNRIFLFLVKTTEININILLEENIKKEAKKLFCSINVSGSRLRFKMLFRRIKISNCA